MVSSFTVNTLLIDGNFLFKKSFFGAKHVYSNGKHIGGLYSFMTKLRSLIKQMGVNKVVVFWDGENGGKMRHRIFSLYKANRKTKDWYNKIELTDDQIRRQEEEQAALWQMIRIKQYLEELFIRQIEVDQIESDDLIATYCNLYHKTEKITIYTNDRDLCQLLHYDNVSVWLDNLNSRITKESYYLHFEHKYSNLLLVKILCGDNADNIKGVKGLGEKTLLKHFPEIKDKDVTLEDVLEKTKTIIDSNPKKAPKILESINEGLINELGLVGKEHYDMNSQIINLLEPMITDEAVEELKITSEQPLDDSDRGSKNLLNLMTEDSFLSHYILTFKEYVTPFYPVILREKDLKNRLIK